VSFDAKETANAERNARKRRRRDARLYHTYSLCRATQLQSIDMLGYALRLDNRVYAACCVCLTFIDLASAPPDRFRGSRFLCGRCAEMSCGAATLSQCHVCHAPTSDAHSLAVVDNGEWRTLCLCPRHAAPDSWLWRSPTYVTLATAEAELIPHTRTRARRGAANGSTATLGEGVEVGEHIEDTAWVNKVVRLFNQRVRAEEAVQDDDVDEEDEEEEEEDE
jgi:hypothetical protein